MSLLLVLTLAGVMALPPLSKDEIAKAENLQTNTFASVDGKGSSQARIDALTDDERQLLVRFFHADLDLSRRSGRSESSLHSSPSAVKLARLDDPWGLDAFARTFRNRPREDWHYQFNFVRNAKLIAMVGDLLFKNDVYEAGDDLGFLPTQSTTADGIIQTLMYAQQFQPDINQWGKELSDAYRKGDGEVLTILREWYRANEPKLLAQAFTDIRPGRRPNTAVPEANPPRAETSTAAPTESIPRPAASIPQRQPKSYVVEVVAFAALVLLGALIVFFRRRV